MKKTVTLGVLTFLLCLPTMAGISEKYGEGYEYKKSEAVKGREAFALSPYKDGTYVFVSDGKVYVTSIDTAGGDLSPKECPDFKNIKPTGLVAYDSKRHRLYYTKSYKDYGKDYLYESKPDQNGVWQEGVRMRIRGTVRHRGDMNFVQSAGYNFRDEVIGNFYNPVMSPDGDRIYFSSTMEGSKGGRDIFYVEIENETERVWSYPVNDSLMNTAGDDDWMSFENDTVRYLSSDKTGIMKIYKSTLGKNGVWSMPVALEAPYNTVKENYNMQVCEGAPVQVSTRAGSSALYLYLPIPAEPEPEPEPEPTYEEKKRQFYWVFFLFDFNKDILEEKFAADLDRLYNEMLNFPDAVFEVSGYTDSRGDLDYNDKLSKRRADKITQMLVEKGFPADRLKSIGYGERRLQVPNAQTEEEHAQNRRVEVRIIMDEE